MKKGFNAKRAVAYMLAAVMLFTTVFCDRMTTYAASSKSISSVSLKINGKKVSKKTYTLEAGKTATIKTTVSPKSAKKSVTYKSNKTSVATVSKKGKVTAKKAGTAKITVTATGKNKKKKSTWVKIKVTANNTNVTGISATLSKNTISVGESTQVMANVTPSTAKNKSVTYASGNPAVAVVNNAGIVTGVGAGTAAITVTSVSNPNVKSSVTVTVQAVPVTGITLDRSEMELPVSRTLKLTPTIIPANATNKSVTWSSSDSSIAEVNDNGTVTGKALGTATITATASSGVTASCVVTVTREVASDRISLEVTNPYKDSQNNEYENTVLVGHDMNVRARVIINDQPLGNTNVTLKMTPVFGNSANAFEIRNNYVTTDENGYANFTIGLNNNNSALTAVNSRFQSYEVTASASDQSSSILVKFASISISNLYNENGHAGLGDPIDPSDTASPADDGLATTTSVNGAKTQEYVTSQKVSALDGTDDNTVYFDVAPFLMLPATSETAHTGDWEKDFTTAEGSSGSYSVYNDIDNLTTTTVVEEVPAGLQYITVQFSKLNLSKYSALYIDVYSAEERNFGTLLDHQERTHQNNNDGLTGNLGVQVRAQQDSKSFIIVSIISEGLVDASNTGYVLTKMSGPWATTNNELTTLVELGGCVKFEDVSSKVLYDSFTWSYTDACKYLPNGSEFLNTNYTYTYEVPSFPYTGNAIITVKDSNGNVRAYFTYPTQRDAAAGNRNVNILSPAPSDTTSGAYAVLVSSDEISAQNRNVGTLTQSGNVASVRATRTGFTELKATITVPELNETELNSLNGGELYTSVQWAPIPSKEEAEIIPDYFAVEGQNVTITAQLYDSNGNRKTDSGKTINFYYTDAYENKTYITAQGQEIGGDANGNNKATVVEYVSSTDSTGKIQIKLLGNGIDFVEGFGAETLGYKVGLTFDNSDPGASLDNTRGNIYWVDLGVTYVDSAVAADNPTRTSWFENSPKDITRNPSSEVGKTWHIGFIPVAQSHKFDFTHNTEESLNQYPNIGIGMLHLPSEFISISGIMLDYSTNRSSNAELNEVKDNVVSLYSEVSGSSTLTGVIKPDSISPETTFTFYDEDMNRQVYPNVGTGTPTVDNTGLNLTMNWTISGLKAEILTPAGTTLTPDTDSVIYVEVLDNFDNKATNQSVKYTITGPNATDTEQSGMTDEHGIYAIELPAPDTTGTSIISVSVGDDIKKSVSISYTDSASNAFGLQIDDTARGEYAVEITGEKELTVYFSSAVNASTIQSGEFTLTEDGNENVTYTVTNAAAGRANNSVVLTLDQSIANPGATHTLTIDSWEAENGIVYHLMSRNGQKLSPTAVSGENQGSSYSFKPSERNKTN